MTPNTFTFHKILKFSYRIGIHVGDEIDNFVTPVRNTITHVNLMYIMAIRAVEFSNGGQKIRKIFA
jgi:hypothetical protein